MHRACICNDVRRADTLVLEQPTDGYRYCLDPFLLADFAAQTEPGMILDMGCGVGVVGLVIAWLRDEVSIVGVEIQKRLFDFACSNTEKSGLSDRVQMLHGDFREIAQCVTPGSITAVVSNPPFQPLGAGRICPNDERAVARHEISGGVGDVIAAGADVLEVGGCICLVYPAHRWGELSTRLKDAGFKPRRIRFVHPRCEEKAHVVLVEAQYQGEESLEVCDPLIIYTQNDEYTSEVGKLFAKLSPYCY